MAWISVSIGAMASTVRMTRSSMLEVIRQDISPQQERKVSLKIELSGFMH